MEQATKKKVGIGVGITLGVLVIALIAWLLLRTPKAQKDAAAKEGGAGGAGKGTGNEGGLLGRETTEGAKSKVGDLVDTLLGKAKDWLPPPDDNLNQDPPDSSGIGLTDPDPYNPTAVPVMGKYYAVKSGDSDASIVVTAGFPQALRFKARKAMRNHTRNGWIGTWEDPDASYGFKLQLRLFQRWTPLPGYESKSWAWNTDWTYHHGPPNKWPVVYVPNLSEVEG